MYLSPERSDVCCPFFSYYYLRNHHDGFEILVRIVPQFEVSSSSFPATTIIIIIVGDASVAPVMILMAVAQLQQRRCHGFGCSLVITCDAAALLLPRFPLLSRSRDKRDMATVAYIAVVVVGQLSAVVLVGTSKSTTKGSRKASRMAEAMEEALLPCRSTKIGG